MKNILANVFIMTVVFLSGNNLCFSADVEMLSGKVKTILDKKTISVFLLDKDGSILDIAHLDKQGNYHIDPTVMDNPEYIELTKLKLLIKNKSGAKKEVKISENIDAFIDNKVKLGVQLFP